MWPVTEAHLMGWNDTNSFCALTSVCLSKQDFSHLLKAIVGLFWNLFSAPSDIQGSHLLHRACYLTLLLKYVQGRNTEIFFGLKKFHISKQDKIPIKMVSHLEFWASNRLEVSLSDCE